MHNCYIQLNLLGFATVFHRYVSPSLRQCRPIDVEFRQNRNLYIPLTIDEIDFRHRVRNKVLNLQRTTHHKMPI